MNQMIKYLAVLTLIQIGTALAQGLPYPYGQYPGYQQPGFRPQPNNNASGVPPTQQSQTQTYTSPNGQTVITERRWNYSPYYSQGYQQPQSTQQDVPPVIEIAVSESSAYVHQNLILTVGIGSPRSLEALDIALPNHAGVLFRKLGETRAENRRRAGQVEVHTRQRYLLTPLEAGDLSLEPVEVDIVYPNSYGQKVKQTLTSAPIALTITPAKPNVRPWLPLADYQITSDLQGREGLAEGGPLTLVVTQEAEGAAGAQLPQIQRQLERGDFRVYREDTEVSGTLDDRNRLTGKRTDRFTLMPKHKGRLRVPEVRITWWDLKNDTLREAVLPFQLVGEGKLTGQGYGEELETGGIFIAGSSWVFWSPLVLLAFFVGLYWSWISEQGKGFRQALWARFGELLAPLVKVWRRILHRLAPMRYYHMARRTFADNLPRSWRLWYCVRGVQDFDDPDDWAQALRFLVQRRLGLPAQLPMSRLADYLVEVHPQADQRRVRDLLGQLERAIYSDGRITDFAAWKRSFQKEVGPSLMPKWRRGSESRNRLPALNPGG